MVDILLNLQLNLRIHFAAVSIKQLNSVVMERIMTCGNHDSTVEMLLLNQIGNRRSRTDSQQIYTGSAGCGTSCQTHFKHVTGKTRVLSNQNLRMAVFPVVPSQVLSDSHRHIQCQCIIGASSGTICSKILSHMCYSSFPIRRLHCLLQSP